MFSVFVLLSSVLAVLADGHYGVLPHRYEGGLGYAVAETPKPYQFAYQAEAIGGASVRQETADGSGTVVGSYSLSDEDGRKRVVDYVADGAGFRASVKTNEPGTKSESPADVPTVSEAGDTPVAHVAPAAYSAAYRSSHLHGGYSGLGYRGYPYGAYSGYGSHYGGLGYGYGGALGYGKGYYGGSLGYGSGYYGGAHGYGRGYYGGALNYGRGYYGGGLGYGRGYYGGGLGYGRGYYGGVLGYGRGYYGGGLGYGRGYYGGASDYGGALGYGSRYYGGALGAYGLGFGGYRGYGYGGYPYSHGYGLGHRYSKH